ncbi:MAG: phosphopantothenoylcysteine decarboxylase [Planctomycetota bacterium]
MPALTAVVTFGGTSEPLDDVRVLTNRSSGRFGAAIVRALAAAGVEVTALGSPQALAALRAGGPLPPGCHPLEFETTADLEGRLRALADAPPTLLLMAAAVSDYRPPRHAGKLRSDQERLVLELERTPKLLAGLRAALPETFLVGFKLLSGVPQAELVAVAARQAQENQLDLTVANDLQALTEREHPVLLVGPSGEAEALTGLRGDVAHGLVAHVLAQLSTGPALAPPAAAPVPEAAETLRAAHPESALWREGPRAWLGDGAGWRPAALDPAAWRVGVEGAPPVDGALLAWLARVSGASGVARLQPGLGVAQAEAPGVCPRGSRAEGQLAADALLRAARCGLDPSRGFLLDRGPAGLLLGLGSEAPAAARSEAEAGYRGWLGALGVGAPSRVAPLWWGPRVVGAVGLGADWVEPWVLPAKRGRGFGDRLADALTRAGRRVGLPAASDPGFFLRRGFRPTGEVAGRTLLAPPSVETPARVGASVCLVDPTRRRVLVGRRLRDPWAGRTSFPGGGVEAGETPWAAARRELEEETGLETWGAPLFERVVYAGDASHVLRVHCFAVGALLPEAPRETAEFAAEWLELDQALARQLTPCARPVLDAVAAWLRA